MPAFRTLLLLTCLLLPAVVSAQEAEPLGLTAARARIAAALNASEAMEDWQKSHHTSRGRIEAEITFVLQTDVSGIVDSVRVISLHNLLPEVAEQFIVVVQDVKLAEIPGYTGEFSYSFWYEPARTSTKQAVWAGVTAGLTVGLTALLLELLK